MSCESGDGGGSGDLKFLVFCVILLEGILVLCVVLLRENCM